MNIKGLNSISIPAVPLKTEKTLKSDSTTDRDANAQYFHNKNKKKQAMTEEQFEQALKTLSKKSFMLEMNWTAKKVVIEEIKYAEVTNTSDEVIRTISEFDMWDLFSDEGSVEKNKGQLLKKIA
ncbi:MAG: hypothetical protein H7Z71_11845 [Moraxellaceae bacterium]|nr:hypothetical protein [Pseudobdellovibrionaceae bacterium]